MHNIIRQHPYLSECLVQSLPHLPSWNPLTAGDDKPNDGPPRGMVGRSGGRVAGVVGPEGEANGAHVCGVFLPMHAHVSRRVWQLLLKGCFIDLASDPCLLALGMGCGAYFSRNGEGKLRSSTSWFGIAFFGIQDAVDADCRLAKLVYGLWLGSTVAEDAVSAGAGDGDMCDDPARHLWPHN